MLLHYVLLSQSFQLIEIREIGDDSWLSHCVDNHFLDTWQVIIYGQKSEITLLQVSLIGSSEKAVAKESLFRVG